MKTTIDFLDAIKARYSLPSDYALQDVLGVTKQTVSRYRNGLGFFDDEVAIKVAELLDLDAGRVLATVAAERAKSKRVRAAWLRLAGAVAAVLVAFTLPVHESPFIPVADESMCIMSNAAAVAILLILLVISSRPPR